MGGLLKRVFRISRNVNPEASTPEENADAQAPTPTWIPVESEEPKYDPATVPENLAPAAELTPPTPVPVPHSPAPAESIAEALFTAPAAASAEAEAETSPTAGTFLLNPPLPKFRNAAALDIDPSEYSVSKAPRPKARRAKAAVSRSKPRRAAKPLKGEIRMKPTSIAHARIVTLKPQTMNGHNGANGHHVEAAPAKTSAAARPDPVGSLAWLHFLSKNVDPGALHLLLTYYHRLGWIPKGAYGWLRDLAQGVARQMNNLTWDQLRIESERLIQIHTESHRMLSALFPPPPAPAAVSMNGNGHGLVHAVVSARRIRK